MSEIVSFTNRNVLLENQISEQVQSIASAEPLRLPGAESPLVASFKQKIEGNYQVERAKTDTDHAIELLYIAYNTTPQAQGAIRVRIASIMNRLIQAQQQSERTINGAVRIARNIVTRLSAVLPDWLDVKEGNDGEEIRAFVGGDLLEMARYIANAASGVRDSLVTIVDNYEQILRDVEAVMASSEIALSDTLEANRKIKQEIVEASARREELDSLVSALQEQIKRFDTLAREYGLQAKSTEQKAFWASLLKSVTQVLSAVVPLAAMGATGGSSALLGVATVGALANQHGANADPAKLVEKASLEAQRTAHGKSVADLQRTIAELEAQREAAGSELALEELDKHLERTRGELRAAQERLGGVEQQLGALLRELSEAVGEVGAQLKHQASSLRQLEQQMLGNVERYEAVRREQAAELVRITVLLDGKRSEQSSIELAVKSLNLSVAALKRSKEIVEEIAFFFKSFTDFMQLIIDEALERVEDYERAGNSASLRRNRLAQLVLSTDQFFVTQAAEWLAVGAISADFVQVFNDGWSKLNSLSGTYITGDKLEAYLEQASYQLKVIVEEREAASARRIASLRSYRAELESRAAQG
ncbi:tyrosyl-tRNA deacylase [Pseudomonas sp. UFMG81]|uniref:tyrosyl-tRNA deacylase n=1 Tax=Pseudomonas sp. UFMG81 TaxID=2745936 RepID=UPI00188E1C89|nr:tyrosyl-tRNA deacylase [Pseudomonas sp. UFMG81]